MVDFSGFLAVSIKVLFKEGGNLLFLEVEGLGLGSSLGRRCK
jgi:hypothetical protein